jgi:hypothetical protein
MVDSSARTSGCYSLEFNQIKAYGLHPLVSLTDHDDIEAPTSLQAIDGTRAVPISIEWTVSDAKYLLPPGRPQSPPLRARSMVKRMQEFTHAPSAATLTEILAGIHATPGYSGRAQSSDVG